MHRYVSNHNDSAEPAHARHRKHFAGYMQVSPSHCHQHWVAIILDHASDTISQDATLTLLFVPLARPYERCRETQVGCWQLALPAAARETHLTPPSVLREEFVNKIPLEILEPRLVVVAAVSCTTHDQMKRKGEW